MSNRNFKMRLTTTYKGEENNVESTAIEVFKDDTWESFELSSSSPGFLIFVYSLLGCQHLYFRTNCAEKGLLLQSSMGVLDLGTAQSWEIDKIHVDFSAHLHSGTPEKKEIDYILSRMKQCPVSKNVSEPEDLKTSIQFM